MKKSGYKYDERVQHVFDTYTLDAYTQRKYDEIVKRNQKNSGRFKHHLQNVRLFQHNLFTLIDLTNMPTNTPNIKIALQIQTGVIDLGDYLAIHSEQLKKTMGSFSHSSIKNYLLAIGSPQIKGEQALQLLHSTFLGQHKFLIRKWSVRKMPKRNGQLLKSTRIWNGDKPYKVQLIPDYEIPLIIPPQVPTDYEIQSLINPEPPIFSDNSNSGNSDENRVQTFPQVIKYPRFSIRARDVSHLF